MFRRPKRKIGLAKLVVLIALAAYSMLGNGPPFVTVSLALALVMYTPLGVDMSLAENIKGLARPEQWVLTPDRLLLSVPFRLDAKHAETAVVVVKGARSMTPEISSVAGRRSGMAAVMIGASFCQGGLRLAQFIHAIFPAFSPDG